MNELKTGNTFSVATQSFTRLGDHIYYIYIIYIYRVYQKKGNRTLQCSSAFIVQSTEIILSKVERPRFRPAIFI